MKLNWVIGKGPATTQELADVVEKEGVLGRLYYADPLTGLRCIMGVIHNHTPDNTRHRSLDLASWGALYKNGLSVSENDLFEGTSKKRCAEMVRRLRAIP